MFLGFHDSVIKNIEISNRQANVMFDNFGWYGVIEFCFEGLISVNLNPSQENYSNEIFGATLIVKDECIFWTEDTKESEIIALNLKWRKI